MIQYSEPFRFPPTARRTGCPACAGHDKKSLSFNPCNRLREIPCGEGCEIVDALADADEVYRQFVLFGQSHQDAAARGTVELCHHQARDPCGTTKRLDLRQR